MGPGCPTCSQQGTVGRTVVAEVIIPDDRFYRYLRQGEKTLAVNYWLQELGGKTMQEHAIEKVAAGLIDPRMAEKVVGHFTVPTAAQQMPLLHVVEGGGAT